MWIGIVVASCCAWPRPLLRGDAKLYPGTGSSYYFAEQSFLNHDKVWRWARLSKFIVDGLASLLLDLSGVMVGHGNLCGYLVAPCGPIS